MNRTIALASTIMSLMFCASAQAAELTGTLKKIKETGSITLGVRESSIPFAYLDNDQKPIGYAVDICKQIVNEIQKKLSVSAIEIKYQPLNASNRIPLVTNGTVDLECASTSNLVERQKVVAFSTTHFISTIKPLVNADSPYKSLTDLNGKPVALVVGMTAIPMLQKYATDNNITFERIYGKDVAEAFLLFQTGRAQAFVYDDVLLASMAAKTGNPKNYRILDQGLRSEPNAMMMRRDDPDFKQLVDGTITDMIKSGDMEKLYTKWFLSPIAPNNVNLNFPMSNELIESFKAPNDRGV